MMSNEAWATEDDVPTPTKVPQPVGYRILIRPKGPVSKTKGGIYLPDKNATFSFRYRSFWSY